MLLKTEGFDVDIAAGLGDLQILLARPGFSPAAVVADFHLHGGETGPDVVRHLRAALGRDVPAIFVSGDTSSMPAAACAIANATVLPKPVDPDAFLRVLRHSFVAA
jgi:CheY-like chemotaxis protein